MQLKTFNTILSDLCDTFDSYILPKSISRSNTNVIYLILKAIAKGYEVINNICLVLNNKFNPESCSEEDLESVAKLVGTEKLKGSASGLAITARNTTDSTVYLQAGMYHYYLDDDTVFTFEVLPASSTVPYIELAPNATKDFFAFSEEVGSYPVTTQNDIIVVTDKALSSSVKFSCEDNSSLLGTSEETNLEFRQRILTTTDRQDSITELQTKIKNLPYIYDCKIIFNDTLESKTVDGITIPSYYMVIFYSGAPRTEIAEKVAQTSIFPTVNITSESDKLLYVNDVFYNGNYEVYITPFRKFNYKVRVDFSYDSTYITLSSAQSKIRSLLESELRGHKHTDYIKESDIYAVLDNLDVAGVDILNVELMDSSSTVVSYLTVPKSRIPYLSEVTFPSE